MPLKESGEMYLESIYILCKSKSSVRSIDVAEYMNFSKPSVSRGVGILKKREYIKSLSDILLSLLDTWYVLPEYVPIIWSKQAKEKQNVKTPD